MIATPTPSQKRGSVKTLPQNRLPTGDKDTKPWQLAAQAKLEEGEQRPLNLYEAANFISLIASLLATAPPIRLTA
ncbi:hypothetical protein SBA_ch1_20360 [Sphingomonas bisphenolicum]|uniref:Uncharacterized protein n=1 Tax=Sphingomonas bisphenolicum TaxID=296544 RepID=A0ABM7FXH6_9SPHN|nr:hypothetical protein SBA_ch1_20360 [Sphingomonas bisphenolicum]